MCHPRTRTVGAEGLLFRNRVSSLRKTGSSCTLPAPPGYSGRGTGTSRTTCWTNTCYPRTGTTRWTTPRRTGVHSGGTGWCGRRSGSCPCRRWSSLCGGSPSRGRPGYRRGGRDSSYLPTLCAGPRTSLEHKGRMGVISPAPSSTGLLLTFGLVMVALCLRLATTGSSHRKETGLVTRNPRARLISSSTTGTWGWEWGRTGIWREETGPRTGFRIPP